MSHCTSFYLEISATQTYKEVIVTSQWNWIQVVCISLRSKETKDIVQQQKGINFKYNGTLEVKE